MSDVLNKQAAGLLQVGWEIRRSGKWVELANVERGPNGTVFLYTTCNRIFATTTGTPWACRLKPEAAQP